MSDGKRLMNFRLTIEEADILAAYCQRTGRTQTDVLRELVRALAPRPTPPRSQPVADRPAPKRQARKP